MANVERDGPLPKTGDAKVHQRMNRTRFQGPNGRPVTVIHPEKFVPGQIDPELDDHPRLKPIPSPIE